MRDFDEELARAATEAFDPHGDHLVITDQDDLRRHFDALNEKAKRPTPVQRICEQMAALPVPAEGPVLFVLHLNEMPATPEEAADMASSLQASADDLAPGRNRVAVLTHGLRLEVLTDEQLEPINLQHIPQLALQTGPTA